MRFPSLMALGGGSEIGGSSYWLRVPWPGSKHGYLSIVIDCGMRPRTPFVPPDLRGIDHVDAVFVSHPHADHSVYVPLLASMFCKAPIFMTQETFDMCVLQWRETVSSMWKRNILTGEKPLYTEADVARMIKEQIRIITFFNRFELPANMLVTPVNGGHMLGTASFHFVQNLGFARKVSIFHAVDISFENQCLIPGAPRVYLSSDEIQTVVGDATGLAGTEVNRAEEAKRFIIAVREVLAQSGRIIIPVFKYHKAQEIWELLLSNGIPPSLVFVDGNAEEMFGIYQKYTSIHPLPSSQIMGNSPHERWRRRAMKGPRVILAFGGMAHEKTPAWRNMRQVIENENDAFFAVGYTEPCSPGGEFLDHVAEGKTEIEIGLERFEIKCRVEKFGLGSHGGHSDLMGLAERARDRVIWVHGDDKRVRGFLKKDAPRHHLQGRNGKEIRL